MESVSFVMALPFPDHEVSGKLINLRGLSLLICRMGTRTVT